MFWKYINQNKLLSKEQRKTRFPTNTEYKNELHGSHFNMTNVRKIGLSTEILSPKHLYNIIEKYYQSLDISNQRQQWLGNWLSVIKKELYDLSKYEMEDIGRITIVQNQKAIFEFYLIKDINIQEVETVVINLDHTIDETNYVSNIFTSVAMIFSLGTVGYILSNIV